MCFRSPALVGAPLCDKDPIAATSTNRDAVATLTGLMSREQRIIMPITNSGYGVGEHGKFLQRGFAAAPDFALRARQGRGGKDRARARQRDQPAAGHGLRHGAAHAHRSSGERFRLSRRQRPVRGAVRGAFQAQLHSHSRRRARLHTRHDDVRRHEGPAVQCRPVGRQPVEGGAVRAHQGAPAELPVYRSAGRRGSRTSATTSCPIRGSRRLATRPHSGSTTASAS